MDQGYSSTLSTSREEYEVFLSFRGKDTRKGFTDFLYTYLVAANICTFRDDNKLRVGEEIGPELLKAIKESKISIPIFSKNYASSKWCLRELAQIVECHTNEGQMIYPIFYDVDPDEVRHQSRSYKDAFSQHKNNFDEKTIQGWKEAMRKVGQLKGLELTKETNGLEGELVKKVVQEVLLRLKKNYRQLPDNLVGLDDHVKSMKELLNVDSNGIRVVGIHGMGGLGKTTIAKVIYNELCEGFECCCFIEDVRANSEGRNGIVDLQTHLLSKIRKNEVGRINNVDEGIKQIEHAVGKKKVIIVLDDVDDRYQFDKLVGKCNWFGAGSRIIVTTRNKGLLDTIEATCQIENLHDVYRSYEPHLMKSIHSLELFSKYAFMRDSPPEDYGSLAQKVVSSAGGLPLVLVTIGSLLFGTKDIALWEEKLRKLKEVPPEKVLERLRISFNALDYGQRQIFLDIACFFIGEDYTNYFYFWEACGFYPREGLNALVLRSMIKIEDDNELRMHDQLRDLGREIVCEENMAKPGKRSRLWCSEQASKLLEGRLVTLDVEALNLNSEFRRSCLVGKDFKKLRNLRYLSLGWADLDGDFKQRLSNLRWLDWECSGDFSPTNCHLKNLVVLNLSGSNIPDNWKGWSEIEMAKELKVLRLSCPYNLRIDSIISNFKSLERLRLNFFQDRFEMFEIDPSIWDLTNLRVLDLSDCQWLRTLDCSSCSALENLEIRNCINLCRLDGLEKLKSLRYLNMDYCCNLEILLDLSNFKKLKELAIVKCEKLTEMQGLDRLESFDVLDLNCCFSVKRLHGLSNLRMLKKLDLDCCSNLRELDEVGVLESLEHLDMYDCKSIEKLPDLSNLTKLKKLDLSGCEMLREVKGLSVLKSLEILDLSDCKSMKELPDLSSLKKLVVLKICGWHDLTEIRGLEELKSLESLNITSCCSIEQLPDLSNHINLYFIDVSYCEKLTDIMGIAEWKSLKYMDIEGCKSLNLPRLPDSVVDINGLNSKSDSSFSANPHDEPVTRNMRKIVIKLRLHYNKCRSKAIRIATMASGVISVAIEGEKRDKMVVIGDRVDAAALVRSMRKKVGYAILELVDEVK